MSLDHKERLRNSLDQANKYLKNYLIRRTKRGTYSCVICDHDHRLTSNIGKDHIDNDFHYILYKKDCEKASESYYSYIDALSKTTNIYTTDDLRWLATKEKGKQLRKKYT